MNELVHKEIISAAEAARILGVPPQMVRERIKRGIWKFGRRIPKEKFGGKQDRYEIYTQKMLNQIGGGNAKL